MKKLIKNEKGITLIALIITIILLLILAIVTISAVNEGNLFAHANNAATKYTAEAELENTKITEWISKMEQYDTNNATPAPVENPTPTIYPDLNKDPSTGCILGHTYEFETVDSGGGNLVSGVLTITTEGDVIFGTAGIDGDTNTIPYDDAMSYIEAGQAMATGNKVAFPGDNNNYVTFIFNGTTADFYYNCSELGGTDGTHAVTK